MKPPTPRAPSDLPAPAPRLSGPVALLLLVSLGLVSLVVAPVLLSQPPGRATVEPDPAASVVSPNPGVGLFVGPHACGSPLCHGSTRPRDVYPVRQDEYHVWSTRDPHARAWEVLSDSRSVVIGRNLGLGVHPRESRRCLSCHVLTAPKETTAPTAFGSRLAPEDGISCEGCHGPAGGWIGSHDEEGYTTADATADGMIDVSDPSTRASLCLSCHLGEGPGSDKRVDHLLLAAGHPQLTFELDNYGASVAHWREPGPEASVASWATGQAAALEAELARLAAHAEAGAWPELSALRCRDCHHGLEEERWRRSRVEAVTGQPRWSPARWVMLRPLLTRLAPAAAASATGSLDALADAVGRLETPPDRVASAARNARDDAARARALLADRDWPPETLVDLLAALAADRFRLAEADYEAAQQVAFAANTLASALVASDPTVLSTPLPDAVEALYDTTRSPYRFDRERFTDALARLERAVGVLPSRPPVVRRPGS